MIRSVDAIEREIALTAKAIDGLNHVGDPLVHNWTLSTIKKNSVRLERLQNELAEAQGFLEWSVDGAGIHNHSIRLQTLVNLVEPLDRSLRYVAQDIARTDKDITVSKADQLATASLIGVFPSSFGMRIAGPTDFDEQLSLNGSVFDRCTSRVLDLFGAASAVNFSEAVLGTVVGLQADSLKALKQLSLAIAKTGSTTKLRWHRSTVVRLEANEASNLADLLGEVEPHEDDIIHSGILNGLDRVTREFTLTLQGEHLGRHIKGRIDPPLAASLTGIVIGSSVTLKLRRVTARSRLSGAEQMQYTLVEVLDTNN